MTNHHLFWHNHYNRHRMFYGPSRLVWFTIGSVATWAWMHHHHHRNHYKGEGRCPPWRTEYNRRDDHVDDPSTPAQVINASSSSSSSPPPPDYAEWQRRQQQQQQPREWWRPAPTHPSQSQGAPGGHFDAHVPDFGDVGPNGNDSDPAPQREPGVAAAAAAAAAAGTATVTGAETAFPIDFDPDRLRQIGRNAEETINGMSEATIDSVMSTLQRLKDRMAERRGQQQQQQQQQQQDTERQQTNPTPAPPPEQPPRPRHWV